MFEAISFFQIEKKTAHSLSHTLRFKGYPKVNTNNHDTKFVSLVMLLTTSISEPIVKISRFALDQSVDCML